MLRLSQTTGHAVRALSCLNHQSPRFIREVAASAGIGKPYLAKIFNLLANTDLLVAKRGYRGGILLARPATEITLLQVVDAVEGDAWTRRCLLGMRDCDPQNLCPCHDMWTEMKSRIRASLGEITLAEVGPLSANQDWAAGLGFQEGDKAILSTGVSSGTAKPGTKRPHPTVEHS